MFTHGTIYSEHEVNGGDTLDPSDAQYFPGYLEPASGWEPFDTNYGHLIVLRFPQFLLKTFPGGADYISKAAQSVDGFSDITLGTTDIQRGPAETAQPFPTSIGAVGNELSFGYTLERGTYGFRLFSSWVLGIRDLNTNLFTANYGIDGMTSSIWNYTADFLIIATTPDTTNMTGRIIEGAALFRMAFPTTVPLGWLNRSSGSHDKYEYTMAFKGRIDINPAVNRFASDILSKGLYTPTITHSWQTDYAALTGVA